jgi:hypothetical protein
MVRALLEGRKTQTRRVCKAQPFSNGYREGSEFLCRNDYLPPDAMLMRAGSKAHPYDATQDEWPQLCPYGVPGDRLVVRETWGLSSYTDDTDWLRCSVKGQSQDDLIGSWKLRFAADYDGPASSEYPYWRPSIFMPRWASRITLEVTDVRVERVQDISEADAQAEGVERQGVGWRNYWRERESLLNPLSSARGSFSSLWESINGTSSLAHNPWVWVVGFKVVGQ